jgi:hypothetical protein
MPPDGPRSWRSGDPSWRDDEVDTPATAAVLVFISAVFVVGFLFALLFAVAS